jgi:hypothetical protein
MVSGIGPSDTPPMLLHRDFYFFSKTAVFVKVGRDYEVIVMSNEWSNQRCGFMIHGRRRPTFIRFGHGHRSTQVYGEQTAMPTWWPPTESKNREKKYIRKNAKARVIGMGLTISAVLVWPLR